MVFELNYCKAKLIKKLSSLSSVAGWVAGLLAAASSSAAAAGTPCHSFWQVSYLESFTISIL